MRASPRFRASRGMVTFVLGRHRQTGMDPKRFFMQRPVSPRGTGSNSVSPLQAASMNGAEHGLRVVRSLGELRPLISSARTRGFHDRARSDDGCAPRGTSLAHPQSARAVRRRRRLALRQPNAVRRGLRPARAIRATRNATRAREDAGADMLFAPAVEEVYPASFGDDGARCRRRRSARGRCSRGRATSTASRRSCSSSST